MNAEISLHGRLVYLQVGNQSFPIGVEWSDEPEAAWYAKQLQKALTNFKGSDGKAVLSQPFQTEPEPGSCG